MIIVGLGSAGCNIAKAFSKFPQYETHTIDTSKEADITIRTRTSHEAYDANFPNLKRKLKFAAAAEVIVVVAGSGTVSGGILQLLSQLQNQRVTLVYIQPDLDLATTTQRMQERVVRNVLQEYARSGALEAIWLIDNLSLERSIGEVSIMAYYETLNQGIVNTIHMINVFKNTPPIIGTFVAPSPLSRIATIGIVDIEEGENQEKWFYDLTGAQEVVYYYGINKEDLKNDGTLFRKINNFVKSKIEDGIDVSYGVFETTYEQKYCYCIKYSPMVQSYKELLDD